MCGQKTKNTGFSWTLFTSGKGLEWQFEGSELLYVRANIFSTEPKMQPINQRCLTYSVISSKLGLFQANPGIYQPILAAGCILHCTFYAITDIAEYSLGVRLVSQAIQSSRTTLLKYNFLRKYIFGIVIFIRLFDCSPLYNWFLSCISNTICFLTSSSTLQYNTAFWFLLCIFKEF